MFDERIAERLRQPYVVIGIESDDYYRILDDAGRPYLYRRSLFRVIDAHEREDWITEYGQEGEHYAYPAPLYRHPAIPGEMRVAHTLRAFRDVCHLGPMARETS